MQILNDVNRYLTINYVPVQSTYSKESEKFWYIGKKLQISTINLVYLLFPLQKVDFTQLVFRCVLLAYANTKNAAYLPNFEHVANLTRPK